MGILVVYLLMKDDGRREGGETVGCGRREKSGLNEEDNCGGRESGLWKEGKERVDRAQ